MAEQRSSQVATGIFLIGLALIFLFNLSVWPLIMFVIAAALLGAEYVHSGTLKLGGNRVIAALIIVAIGLVNLVSLNINWGSLWPIVLILIGLYVLFGDRIKFGGR
ncbi:MAG: hypothetical protein ACUVSX_15610 [Aggregatilineales bacterium]